MAKDIILDVNNDLLFENGDLVLRDSESQEVRLILEAVKNDFKQYPVIGANLVDFLSGSISLTEITQAIELNLLIDDKNLKVTMDGDNLNIS